MNGSLTYGPLGRLISALAIISAFLGALEASGYVALLPDDYKWVGVAVTALGLLVAGFSERLQGGASKPEVREQAAQSDQKNAIDELNGG
jgi:hypothetical protein